MRLTFFAGVALELLFLLTFQGNNVDMNMIPGTIGYHMVV